MDHAQPHHPDALSNIAQSDYLVALSRLPIARLGWLYYL